MINGLDSLLQNSDIPVTQIQAHLIENKDAFFELKSVCGQFKNVAQISDKYAVARIHSTQAPELFKKEIKLLAILREIGLPVINYYGEMFEIVPGHFAYLMDWINEAILLDSKDVDATNSKLLAFFLGVNLPTGEGWVLQKDKVEQDIKIALNSNSFSLEQLKQKAKKLYGILSEIQEILSKYNFVVCDLQILITPACEVWLIDPLDIAKENNLIPNKPSYISLLDETEQLDLNYHQQLSSAKQMLNKSIAWCSQVMFMQDEKELLNFVLKRPDAPCVSRGGSLLKQIMQKRSPQIISPKHQGLESILPLNKENLPNDGNITFSKPLVLDTCKGVLPLLELRNAQTRQRQQKDEKKAPIEPSPVQNTTISVVKHG